MKKLSVLIRNNQKILRFAACGVISALVEFIVFILIIKLFDIYISAVISFLCGLLSSFLLNRIIVFKSDTKNVKLIGEIIQFIILGLVNSQLSALITIWLTNIVMEELIAKVITMIVIAIWNYMIMNFVIFRQKKD